MSWLFALFLSAFHSFGIELPLEQWDMSDNAVMMCSGDTEVDNDGEGEGEDSGSTGSGTITFTPNGSQDRDRIYNGF